MTKFTFYAEEQEEIGLDKLGALEKALGEEINSVLPVALELVFWTAKAYAIIIVVSVTWIR